MSSEMIDLPDYDDIPDPYVRVGRRADDMFTRIMLSFLLAWFAILVCALVVIVASAVAQDWRIGAAILGFFTIMGAFYRWVVPKMVDVENG